MISFATRRWLAMSLLVVLSALLVANYWFYALTVHRLPYLSGWLLFLFMIVLAAYNVRKKLPFLPLGTSESWLQFHVYAGYLTVVLFFLHIGLKRPTGWFEGTLAVLYGLVILSGIVGLFISRVFPKRLTTRGGEVIYGLIPTVRRSLKDQAEALALKSIPEVESTTIADFYIKTLRDFFDRPRNLLLHLLEVRRPLNALLDDINDLARFLNAQERGVMDKIGDLVRQKDALDYQLSLQVTLRLWLFVHIPLTYSLLIFSVVHIVLVYAFLGGIG
jgi:hypothetical protein